MIFFICIAYAAIASQTIFDMQMIRNFLFAHKKIHRSDRRYYYPRAALIVPCKGIDTAFETNIDSLYHQNYHNYILLFVVSDTDDPAYAELCRIREKLITDTKAADVQILVAGFAESCSQKNHNLLHAYRHLPGNIEIMAFADSDACLGSDWLANIVHPLRKAKVGVTTGYRWFIPKKNNLATLALSVVNAKIAQLLGAYRFNQVWGGSMAIHVRLFKQLRIDQLWANSVTDDLSLGRAVRQAGKRITFVPGCLVASYERTTWRDFFSFGRRQFLLTRIMSPFTWRFGLVSSSYSVAGLYGSAVAAFYLHSANLPQWWLFAATSAVFLLGQLLRSILRQLLIAGQLRKDAAAMRIACIVDITVGWLFSPVLLAIIISSAFGRRVRWRGITYKLISPTRTLVESAKA